MKKLFIIGMVVLLAGCNYSKKVQGINGSLDKTIYMVDGKPLECIDKGDKLSCNWEKHNKLFEGE